MLSVRNCLFVVAVTACLATSAPASAALVTHIFEPNSFGCFPKVPTDMESNPIPCAGTNLNGVLSFSGSFNLDLDPFKLGQPPRDVNVTLSNLEGDLFRNSPVMLTSGLSTDFLNVLLCENVTHRPNPEDDSCPTGISARIEFVSTDPN